MFFGETSAIGKLASVSAPPSQDLTCSKMRLWNENCTREVWGSPITYFGHYILCRYIYWVSRQRLWSWPRSINIAGDSPIKQPFIITTSPSHQPMPTQNPAPPTLYFSITFQNFTNHARRFYLYTMDFLLVLNNIKDM